MSNLTGIHTTLEVIDTFNLFIQAYSLTITKIVFFGNQNYSNMYGPREAPELYRSSDSLSAWLSHTQSTNSVPLEVSRCNAGPSNLAQVRRGSAAALLALPRRSPQSVETMGVVNTAMSDSSRSVNTEQRMPRIPRESITSVETSTTFDTSDQDYDVIHNHLVATKRILWIHNIAIAMVVLTSFTVLVLISVLWSHSNNGGEPEAVSIDVNFILF